ncbi:MAG: DUF3298 domain-containing protein [bacterium]|nr:DUF3298 domain-containing protein [bacterium]
MGRFAGYIVVAALALGIGYFVATRVQPELQAQNTGVATTTPQSVQITTANVNEETSVYTIDVQYPKFGISAIDAKVGKIVNDTIAEFKTLPPNPPGMSSPQNELTVRYESPYVGPDVVSFKLVISQYTGGAHPNSLFSGLNFDRISGKQLLQDDAFKMIKLTAQQVSVAVSAQLKERLGETFFAEGANSNPENFSSFLISAGKVTFIFQPYQVAPYSAGPQEVSFERKR